MTRPLSFRVIEGGRDKPRDDLAPARGVMLAVALSVPLWWPTYVGLSCVGRRLGAAGGGVAAVTWAAVIVLGLYAVVLAKLAAVGPLDGSELSMTDRAFFLVLSAAHAALAVSLWREYL